jgi:hypothetical protein
MSLSTSLLEQNDLEQDQGVEQEDQAHDRVLDRISGRFIRPSWFSTSAVHCFHVASDFTIDVLAPGRRHIDFDELFNRSSHQNTVTCDGINLPCSTHDFRRYASNP